eukprot:34947-Pelagomonas_calceolata.AAC.3
MLLLLKNPDDGFDGPKMMKSAPGMFLTTNVFSVTTIFRIECKHTARAGAECRGTSNISHLIMLVAGVCNARDAPSDAEAQALQLINLSRVVCLHAGSVIQRRN